MSVIGELLVEINGDNSGLKKSLNESGTAAKTGIDKLLKTISAAGLAWKAVDIAMKGIDYNKAAEQAEIAFGVFLGSAGAAKSMIEDLRDLAKETPLEFAEVRDAGLKLQAFGVATEKIIPAMRTLADVSAGLQIPIKDLAYLYGSVQAQGKALTVDLMQFANRGIPIWTELAKVTGVSGAALKKMVEEGKIGFPQVEQAFKNMTSEGGKFFEMANKQMDSLAGSQSNLNDAFDVWLGHLTAGASGPLKEWNAGWASFFAGWVAFDKSAGPAVNDWNKKIGEFADKINPMTQLFRAMGFEVGYVRDNVQDAAKNINLGTAGMGDFRAELKAAKEATSAVTTELKNNLTEIGLINIKIKDGIITEKEGLEQKIAAREKAIQKQYDEYAAGKITKEQLDQYVASSKKFNAENLEDLNRIKIKESEITTQKVEQKEEAEGTLVLSGLQEKLAFSLNTQLGITIDSQAQIEEIVANTVEEIKTWKDTWKDIQVQLSASGKELSSWSGHFSGLSDAAKKFGNDALSKILGQLSEAANHAGNLMSSLGRGDYISAAVSGIQLIADAWDAFFNADEKKREKRRKKEREQEKERLAAVDDLSKKYEDYGKTEAQIAKENFDAEIAYAEKIGASLDTINKIKQKYAEDEQKRYQDAIEAATRARAEEEEAIKKRLDDLSDYMDKYEDASKDRIQLIKEEEREALATADRLGASYEQRLTIQKYYADQLSAEFIARQKEVQDAERAYQAKVQGEIAAQKEAADKARQDLLSSYARAGESIGDVMARSLESGDSLETFRKSFMNMMKKMAIEAWVAHDWFKAKFADIGKSLTDALSDGFFSETEIARLDIQTSSLFNQFQSQMSVINDLFDKASMSSTITATDRRDLTKTEINVYTTSDPLTIANALSNVQHSLAYQGVVA